MNENDRIIEAARRTERGFVATIVRTSGSTYRRSGACCVISDKGEVTGTISGGCLEKDLIARSDQWMRDMQPCTITYDSSRDDDIVFGLGLGCRGVIEIRIEPFDAAHRPQIEAAPRTRIEIFGGGPDVQPLAKLAGTIGWDVKVTTPREVHPEQVGAPDDADAIVIMTHNYLYDLALLRTMLASNARYIGLLGPKSRGEQLLAECGGDRNRIHSPAGLNIGGETPEEIALSILAEAQAVLNERDARHLKELEGPLHADHHRPGCRRV